ncbi:MAG: hypothetical protein H6599_11335 [Flavobacteriales bacterium]|nr:hypothetical protein [Flavobacteriales bacterium]
MVKLLKYSWLLVLFLIASGYNETKAQDSPTIYVEGRMTTSSGKKLTGATITVKKNGSVVKTVTVGSNGKYGDLELPMGFVYTISASCDGYLSKTITIDGKTGYFQEDTPDAIPLEIPFELDEKKPDVDYSPVSGDFQVGKLSIDPATGGLAVDYSYTSAQKSKYEKFFEDLAKEANKEEEEFKKFVENGDKAFQAGNYTEAMTNYEKAKEIKKDDPTVATKITTTEQKIEQKKSFDQAVTAGDGALTAKNYDEAIAKYEKAKSIMPEDKTIDAKINDAKAQKAAAEGAQVDADFQAKMKEADKAFADKDYAYAKTLYQEAGKIKPTEKTPPVKIKECEDIIKKQMEEEQKFNELVAAGDKGMLNEDYNTSIEKYTAALNIKEDSRVKSELEKAKELKKKKEEEADAAAKKAVFDKLIADGDSKLGSQDFDGAIAKYKEALNTGFDNAAANAKIKAAEDAKKAKEDEAAEAAKKAAFEKFISEGNTKLGSEDFDGAVAKYTEALNTGFDNATANAKIKEAQDAKSAKENADAEAAKKQKFDQFMADGNGKLGSEDFDGAIAKYTEALNTGYDNAAANAKIKEAQDAKSAKENSDAEAAKKQKFDQFISDGDSKLGSKDFDGAIAKYQEALALAVDDPKANKKIKEAQDAKAAYEKEMADKNEAEQKQAKFDQFISAGDGKLGSKDFDGAINDYEGALDLDVNNTLANQKLKEAKDAKAAYEQEMADQDAAAKQAQFEKFVAAGDGHLSSNAFDMAINEYESALGLNVNNALANQKIKAAKDAKAAYEAQKASDAAAEAKDKEFNDLIAKGDAAKDARSWEEAKGFYGQAKEVKTDSPIPQKKIDEVNDLMKKELDDETETQFQKYLEKGTALTEAGEYEKAIGLYSKAKGLFAAKEDILNQRIKEVSAMKAKEDEYNKYMASADGLFEAGKWKEAKTDYIKAKGVFDRPRPNEQIALIDQKLADAAAADDAAAEQAKKKQEYDALMAKGKSLKDSKKYQEAIDAYTEAKNILPAETEPQKRINEINDILSNMANENALLEKYQAAIAKADAKRDEAIAAESDDLAIAAKGLYDAAMKIKGDESYPQEQVNYLNNLMEEWAAKFIDKQYQKIIDKADALFAAKNWDGAEELYGRAKDLKPADPYPPAQLEKIKKAKASAGKLDAYNEFVQEGNALFAEKKYQKAIDAYEGALGVKPGAKYPTDKIAEIKALMSDAAQAQKEKIEKENAIEIDPGYYGEEIHMSEEEIEKLWADDRVDEITSKDADYETYKEKVKTDNEDELMFQSDRTESINEDYEQMDTEYAELQELWDEQRKDVLLEIEQYKENKTMEIEGFYDVETNRSNNLNNYYDNSEQARSEYEYSLDENRKENIYDMEEYKLEQSELQLDLAGTEVDVTNENRIYYNDYQNDLEDASEKMDVRREDNIVDMEDYKEIQIDISNDLIDQGVSSTYETYGDYKQMASDYEQFAEDGDLRRKEETVVQMDDFKELQMDINLDNHAESVEKTDAVNDYNMEYRDYLDEFADEMDVPREDNVSAMEIYQSDLSDLYQDGMVINEERSQDNYKDKDKIKEDQLGMDEEESAMVEENMDKMVAYQDNVLDDNASIDNEFSDVGYDNSVVMDSVKTQKATMFSDENIDPLANQYPEGVTEKTFQRTNNLGEVVEITILRIVVRGNKADEYKKVTSKWSTAYFKNGGIINEYIWDTETN